MPTTIKPPISELLCIQSYQAKVEAIASQFKKVHQNGDFITIVKDAVSHKVPKFYAEEKSKTKADLRGMNRVIRINKKEKTCTAKAGVTFEALVRESLKHGLLPYTVPELKTITIGGAVSGCSIESMSYKYGGFFDSCLEIEVITATGELPRRRKSERGTNGDLCLPL